MTRLLILLFALSASAQLPPTPIYPTRYYVVVATDGTNVSAPSNEVATNVWPVELTWCPSTTEDVSYQILSGLASGVYTRTNVCTGLTIDLPVYIPQTTIITIYQNETVLLCETNPVDTLFFRMNDNIVESSVDCLNWTFYTVGMIDQPLTITKQ
jgi:hypothetical protein